MSRVGAEATWNKPERCYVLGREMQTKVLDSKLYMWWMQQMGADARAIS